MLPWLRVCMPVCDCVSVFMLPDALPATQPTASKHWRQCFAFLLDKGPLNRLSFAHLTSFPLSHFTFYSGQQFFIFLLTISSLMLDHEDTVGSYGLETEVRNGYLHWFDLAWCKEDIRWVERAVFLVDFAAVIVLIVSCFMLQMRTCFHTFSA